VKNVVSNITGIFVVPSLNLYLVKAHGGSDTWLKQHRPVRAVDIHQPPLISVSVTLP